MQIGLIIVGDEVLSGRRTDKHLPKVIELLTERGLLLNWVKIIGDDKAELDKTFRDSLAGDDLVFSTGGIGATPDDMTREAVARAIGVKTELHPEGLALLKEMLERNNRPVTDHLYRLIEFPAGSSIIPNPVNQIPGFSVADHHFVPGFPEMAWPMIEWVLDTHYAHLSGNQYQEKAIMVHNQYEGALIPLLETIESEFPAVKVFCLPFTNQEFPQTEIGVKGHAADVKIAFEAVKNYLNEYQYEWSRLG